MKKISQYVIASTVLMGVGFSAAVAPKAASAESNVQSKATVGLKFKGADDITVVMGEKFNPRAGVTLVSSKGTVSPNAQIFVSNNSLNLNKAGTYDLTYVAFDGQGDYIFKNRKVTVTALTDNKPELKATGQVVFRGTSFNPLSYATAWDAEDGDISKNIKVSGHVNMSVSGMYSVNYSITDSAGNFDSKTINVYVM